MTRTGDAIARLMLMGWEQVVEGGDGLGCWIHPRGLRLIESSAVEQDGHAWSHVSVSRTDGWMPTWEQLRDAFRLVHPNLYGYVVIAPPDKHVNIAEVSHVWARLDSTASVLPDFTRGGSSI